MAIAPPLPKAPESFDFRGLTAHARDEVRVLEALHGAFPDTVANGLKALLRADVAVEQPVLELARWHDYTRSLANVTVLATVGMAPLAEDVVVEIDARFALALVERLLGGPGSLPSLRRPSQLEAALITDLFAPVLEGVVASLAPLVEVTPELRRLTFDPDFLDVAEPSDAVVVLGTVVTVAHDHGRATGMVTICYPMAALEPVVAQHPAMRRPGAPTGDAPLLAQLPDLEVELRVQLRPTALPAIELAGLAPGDVLRLDHRVDQPVIGLVEQAEVLLGRAGVRDDRRALEVLATTTVPSAGE